MLLDRLDKKSAIGRLTLKRSFFVCLHHGWSTFASYGQNRPESRGDSANKFRERNFSDIWQ